MSSRAARPARVVALLATLSTMISCYKDVDPDARQKPPAAVVDCSSYAGYIPFTDTRFSEHVMPLLQSHCNEAACHGGAPSEAKARLWLGPPDGEAATETVRELVLSQLVLARALTADIGLVVPGHPEASFLMMKLEGCQNRSSLVCSPRPTPVGKDPCGDTMPQSAEPLAEAELDEFRSWILLGAKND